MADRYYSPLDFHYEMLELRSDECRKSIWIAKAKRKILPIVNGIEISWIRIGSMSPPRYDSDATMRTRENLVKEFNRYALKGGRGCQMRFNSSKLEAEIVLSPA